MPFDIEPSETADGSQAWLATYTSEGRVARFKIEFGSSKVSEAKGPKDFTIAYGDGRFASVRGSDATVLLRLPSKVNRVSVLPFTYVNFGEQQSQAVGGGFFAKPPGNWQPNKLFLGGGEGEVFVNINPVMRNGQSSIKDPDYGDNVLGYLASVL